MGIFDYLGSEDGAGSPYADPASDQSPVLPTGGMEMPDFGIDFSTLDNASQYASAALGRLAQSGFEDQQQQSGNPFIGVIASALQGKNQRIPGPGSATGSGAIQYDPNSPLVQEAARAANEFGLDPNIFIRQIGKESSYNTGEVSPKGARGVAQFMPGTAEAAAQLLGVPVEQLWRDPILQIRGAAALMKVYLNKYGNNYAMALAAYNAGQGAVEQYGGVPPFDETRAYINAILNGAQQAPASGQQTLTRNAPVPGTQYQVSFGYNLPYDQPITGAGGRQITHHEGIDLVRPDLPNNGRGAPVTAFHNGTVLYTGSDNNGAFVIVRGDDGYDHVYVHFDSIGVAPGQRVDRSTVLGTLGASGTEGFPHLHFGVRLNGQPVDPTPWLR